MAKAVYDNLSETPDELAFRRGEVLTVIEQEPNDLQGWWLCSIRGKRGIVPANRLLSLAGDRSTVSILSTGSSGLSHRSSLDTTGQQDIYDVPPSARVATPLNNDCGDIYDTPPKARMVSKKGSSYSELNDLCKDPSYQEISEIPMKSQYDDYAVPSSDEACSSGDSGIVAPRVAYESLSSATKSFSPDNYDIPSAVAKDALREENSPDVAFQRLQMSDSGAVYDVPPQVTKDSSGQLPADWADRADPEPYEPLLLEADTALEVLARLQQDVHASASRLLSFVCKQWRTKESLDAKLHMIKLACMTVKTSLQEYLEFGQGVLATAQNVLPPGERGFSQDMNALLDPLLEGQLQIRKSLKTLDAIQWSHEKLERSPDSVGEDALDDLVATAKGIPTDARSLTLLIQGNAKRLFRAPEESVKSTDNLLCDVSFASLRPPKVKSSGLGPGFRDRLEQLERDAEKSVQVHTEAASFCAPQLHENDALILTFYAQEVNTHVGVLLNAIDAFMKCIDYNMPPKVFITHSKFVILAAHKLVYIGDTISRNLLNEKLRQQISAKGNTLCDALKATVVGTKNAALNYPSVSCSQEMVDKVVEVSQAAGDLKKVITQAS
uniref:SH3 domain-containing protein n=1 Tax=Capitella teleta TaxID=283909 RepID=X2B2Y2_CAPTE